MRKTLSVSLVLALLAACASAPPEPEPEPAPPPVEISETSEPAPPPPPVEAPPPDRPARPAQTDTGMFRISIASQETAEGTARWVRRAEDAGYRTEVLAVDIDGKTWHRVLLPGYASLDEAKAALAIVQEELGVPNAWVTSRRRAPTPAGSEAPPPPDAPAEQAPTPN
jgi:hypothetical protein